MVPPQPNRNLFEALTGIQITAPFHWGSHPVVGFSSLFFLVPPACYIAVVFCVLARVPPPHSFETQVHLTFYPALTFMYICVSVTCCLADYVFIRQGCRSWFGKIDIRLSSMCFFGCIFDFLLRASLLETAVLAAISVAAWLFAGFSKSFEQWAFRHTLWHVVGASVASYGGLRYPPEEAAISGHLWAYVLGANAALLALLAVGAASVWLLLTPAVREDFWTRGAALADWQSLESLEAKVSSASWPSAKAD